MEEEEKNAKVESRKMKGGRSRSSEARRRGSPKKESELVVLLVAVLGFFGKGWVF